MVEPTSHGLTPISGQYNLTLLKYAAALSKAKQTKHFFVSHPPWGQGEPSFPASHTAGGVSHRRLSDTALLAARHLATKKEPPTIHTSPKGFI